MGAEVVLGVERVGPVQGLVGVVLVRQHVAERGLAELVDERDLRRCSTCRHDHRSNVGVARVLYAGVTVLVPPHPRLGRRGALSERAGRQDLRLELADADRGRRRAVDDRQPGRAEQRKRIHELRDLVHLHRRLHLRLRRRGPGDTGEADDRHHDEHTFHCFLPCDGSTPDHAARPFHDALSQTPGAPGAASRPLVTFWGARCSHCRRDPLRTSAVHPGARRCRCPFAVGGVTSRLSSETACFTVHVRAIERKIRSSHGINRRQLQAAREVAGQN